MPKAISNYEKMKHAMAEEFVRHSQEEMIQKFHLKADVEFIYLQFVERNYRVYRHTGRVEWSDDEFKTCQEADYNEAMTIYDVLCNAKRGIQSSGEYVNICSLTMIQGGTLAQKRGFFQHYAEYFDGKAERLSRACKTLSGEMVKQGDVAYRLKLFPFLKIEICFWEADEEFPASLQVYADSQILEYMHYETMMFALTHLLERIKEEMER